MLAEHAVKKLEKIEVTSLKKRLAPSVFKHTNIQTNNFPICEIQTIKPKFYYTSKKWSTALHNENELHFKCRLFRNDTFAE